MKDIFKCLIAVVVALTATLAADARNINVRGSVTSRSTKERLSGVLIYNAATDKLVGTTTDEGRFTVNVPDDATLIFSFMGYEDQQQEVGGRITIDVTLAAEAVQLNELVVSGKAVVKAVVTEPTDLDVKGNYIHIHTRVKVPHQLFNSSARLIIQPALVNVTRKKTTLLDPVVFDGQRYAITQNRMYDFNSAKADPLTPYTRVKETGARTDDWIPFADSAYVATPNDDYRCDLMLSLENYNRFIYEDTVEIGRGTVNPLRWLDYSLAGSMVTDERFLPQPEMQLRDTRGDVNLTFPVGKATLDMSLGDNQAEMDRLLAQLRMVEEDPDAAVKSLKVIGTASPEGSHATNLRLSKARLQSAMSYILNSVSENTRAAETSTEASVHTWEDVAALMRADSLIDQADRIMEIVQAHPSSPDAQYAKVKALPFYRSTILTTYLPRLRTVSYEFITSRYRFLTDDEISEIYKQHPERLSRNEMWRLYNLAPDDTTRAAICRKAVELDPKFVVAATDLSYLEMKLGHPDDEILAPYLASKMAIPHETRLNQALALQAAGQYTRADSLMQLVPDEPQFHKAKIYVAATNGRYLDYMQEISEDSPINEVVLLLAVKSNQMAWHKAQQLGNSAREEYVKAIAANRLDLVGEAIMHFDNAMELDPSLIEVAKIDGDVLDLVNEEE
jgi:hypothetical protein